MCTTVLQQRLSVVCNALPVNNQKLSFLFLLYGTSTVFIQTETKIITISLFQLQLTLLIYLSLRV